MLLSRIVIIPEGEANHTSLRHHKDKEGSDVLNAKPQEHIKLCTGDRGWQEDRMVIGLPLRGITIVDGEDGCKKVTPLCKGIDR